MKKFLFSKALALVLYACQVKQVRLKYLHQ